MTKEPLEPPMDGDQDYNCSHDYDHFAVSGPGKIDVIIPAQLWEFGAGAASALLRLLVEVHRKRAIKNDNPWRTCDH